MHLKYYFELVELGDEIVAVPVGNDAHECGGIITLNEVSAYIFELLKEDITEEAIVRAIRMKYSAPESVVLKDVKRIIKNINDDGLLC